QRTFAVGTLPWSVTVSDVNRDGRPDLVVAAGGRFDPDTNSSIDGGVSVLLGNGDGSFQAPRTFAAGFPTSSVVGADANGDGRPDLVTATSGGGVSVLLGNGDGSFQPRKPYAASGGTVAVADVNGDGHTDLVATSIVPDQMVSVLLGDGEGAFQ